MQIEGNTIRVTATTGQEWTLGPSFDRISSIGAPRNVVDLYLGLFGPHAIRCARRVLTCLCEPHDPLPLLGWVDKDGVSHGGALSNEELLLLAQILMQFSLGNATEEVLRKPEYQSLIDMKFLEVKTILGMNKEDPPGWTSYIAHLREITHG